MNVCSFCSKELNSFSINQLLCFSCSFELSQDFSRKHLGINALFSYKSNFRSLILKAKVQSHKRSLFCLAQIFLNHPKTQALAQKADVIMPAPSSLISRFRGRFDIAWFLAWELALKEKKEFCSAPFGLRFSFKKRTSEEREKESHNLVIYEQRKGLKTFLLIDDVSTTGFTFKKLASHLPKDACLNFLSFAYSRTRLE